MTMTQYQIIPSRFGYPLSARPRIPTWTPPVFNTKKNKNKKKTDFRGRKKRCVLGEIQVVSARRFVTQTTPQVGKTTARTAEKGNIITGQDKVGE
jgi:hypothetical protein